MPPNRGGTIDTIKVGLGVDIPSAKNDIKTLRQELGAGFTLTPQLGQPADKDLKDWIDKLGVSVNRDNQKKIKVPLDFDEGAATTNLETALEKVQRKVQPIIVPIHYDDGGGPSSGGGGGPSSGGGGGRGGGRGGGQGGGGGGGQAVPPPPGRGTVKTSQQAQEEARSKPVKTAATSNATTGAVATAAVVSGRDPGIRQPNFEDRSSDTYNPQSSPQDIRIVNKGQQRDPAHRPVPIGARPGGSQPVSGNVVSVQQAQPTAKRGAQKAGSSVRWTDRGYVDSETGDLVQSAGGVTNKRRRDPAQVRPDNVQAILFNNALESNRPDVIDKMFPGVGTALAAGRVGEARSAFINARSGGKSKAAANIGRRMSKSASEGSKTDLTPLMEDYPLETAVQSAIGSINMGSKPFLKKAGGTAVADPSGQGRSGGVSKPPSDRDFDREAAQYLELRKQLTDITGTFTEPDETGARQLVFSEEAIAETERLEKEIKKAEAAQVKSAAIKGRDKQQRGRGSTTPAPDPTAVTGPYTGRASTLEPVMAAVAERAALRKKFGLTPHTPLSEASKEQRILLNKNAAAIQEAGKTFSADRDLGRRLGESGFAMGGMAGGGYRMREIRSGVALKKFMAENPEAYSRWSPNILADMQPGAASKALFDRAHVERGISVSPIGDREDWPHAGNMPFDITYDMGHATGKWAYRGFGTKAGVSRINAGGEGAKTFKPRSLYFVKGKPVTTGADGEPVLDPTSILPLARVRRSAIDEIWRERNEAPGESLAMGGRPSSLSDLPGVAGRAVNMTKVGEHGPEALVDMAGGGQFVVPNHQLRQFEGMAGMHAGGPTVGSHIHLSQDEWYRPGVDQNLRNTSTGRQIAGGIPPIRDTGPEGLGIVGSGGGGTFAQKRARAGMAGQAAGTAAATNVTPVYVTNFAELMKMGGAPGTTTQNTPTGRQTTRNVATPLATAAPTAPSAASSGTTLGGAPATGTTATQPRQGRASGAGAAAKFAGIEAASDLQEQLDEIGTGISEALQKSPVRALSVAFGQIAQTVIGGRDEILKRAGKARASHRLAGVGAAEVRAAGEQAAQAEFEIAVLENKAKTTPLNKKETENLEGFRTNLQAAREREGIARPIAEELTAKARKDKDDILTAGQQVRSQAVGLGGIVGGTLLFTAAMNLAQQGIQLLGDAATKAGDTLTGFSFTAKREAEALSEQILARSGDTQGAISARLAQLGTTASSTNVDALTRRAGLLAGAQNLQGARDLRRGGEYFDRNRGQVIPGIGTGFGNGLFGSFINQQQGAVELLASELKGPSDARTQALIGAALGNAPEGTPAATVAGISGRSGIMAGVQDFADSFQPLERVADFIDQGARVADNEAARAARGGGERTDAIEAMVNAAEQRARDQNKQWADRFNEGVDKWVKYNGSPVVGQLRANQPEGDVLATQRALEAIGAGPSQLQKFKAAGISATNQQGEVISADQLNVLIDAFTRSTTQPGQRELLGAQERQDIAQLRAIERDAQLQTRLIPATAAQNLIAQPFAATAQAGVTAATGVDPTAAAAAGKWSERIVTARDALTDIREQGLTELRALGVPQQAIDDVTKLGTAIVRLQTKASDLQLGLEQAQFNEQVRISLRGIGDLVGLTGQAAVNVDGQVVGATKLGILQREQIRDQRELARIQLGRSQREINLQLALSRLRSPGETPEERAVRRREAELIAKERQRELDINKGMTGRGFQIQDIQFGRQLGDAVKQFQLLQQARRVSIEVRGIQQVMAAKQALLQVKQQFLEVPKSAGIAVRQAGNRVIATLESRLGALSERSAELVNDHVSQLIRQYTSLFDSLNGGGRNTEGTRAQNARATLPKNTQGATPTKAAGGIFSTAGATRFIAGEAGSETVLVLRNPREGMGAPAGAISGSGGMAGGIKINVQLNAEVRGEADENRLARKVARMLHDEVALLVTA